MKMKKALWLLLFLVSFLTYGKAQTIQINVFMNDGTEQIYTLAETDRLYFEDNTKLVVEAVATNSTVVIPLADIRKITCDEYVGTEENHDLGVALFPNPVTDVLMLRNLSGAQNVSIYAIDGRLVKSVEAQSDLPISVGELPVGLYLVKTQSCTLKMIKL